MQTPSTTRAASQEEQRVWKDALGRVRVGAQGLHAPQQAARITPTPTPATPTTFDVQFQAAEVTRPAPPQFGKTSEPQQSDSVNLLAPPSSRAGGYRPTTRALEAEDPDGRPAGEMWSLRKLIEQLRDSMLIDAMIFVVNEGCTASAMEYWRPVAWSMAWITMTILVTAAGFVALRARHSFGLIMFAVLQLMFSAINLQHLNMSHSETVRGCNQQQSDYRHCNVAALSHCITENTCSADEMSILKPPCHAPSQAACTQFATMGEGVFWLNQLINFLTYAEPTFWAICVIVRLEISKQSEGGDHSAFRRLLTRSEFPGPPLKEEAALQPFNSCGAVLMLVASCAVLVANIISTLDM